MLGSERRRHFLSGYGSVAVSIWPPSSVQADEFPTTTPEAAGFVSDLAARIDAAVTEGAARGLHGVVVVRDGKLVCERYFEGPDQSWGCALGTIRFNRTTLHDLRSVTKSIVGLLYGIALSRGQVPAPDQPLLAQFPEYPDLAADPKRGRLTIAHVLTMTLGTEWDEDAPYTSAANSEIKMERAPDRYRFILGRPIVEEPGRRWIYNGGATALLGRLIATGTGQLLPDFAREALFDPLGIGITEWIHGPDGVPSAASGLRMTPLDLARIGQAILDRRVVPADWLEKSFMPVVPTRKSIWYGYHWYFVEAHPPWITASGNGGQRLYLVQDQKLVVAITAGGYNQPDQPEPPPVALFRDVILKSLA